MPSPVGRRLFAPALAALLLSAGPALAEPPLAGSSKTPTTTHGENPTPYDTPQPAGVAAPDAAGPTPGLPPPPTPGLPPPPTSESPPQQAAAPYPAPPPPWVVTPSPQPSILLDPLPEPRRSPGMIAGGVVLAALGGGGVIGGFFMVLIGTFSQAFNPGKHEDMLIGGATSMVLGGVALGVGIPLIRSGARKIVRDPPSAELWLAPGRLTVTF